MVHGRAVPRVPVRRDPGSRPPPGRGDRVHRAAYGAPPGVRRAGHHVYHTEGTANTVRPKKLIFCFSQALF